MQRHKALVTHGGMQKLFAFMTGTMEYPEACLCHLYSNTNFRCEITSSLDSDPNRYLSIVAHYLLVGGMKHFCRGCGGGSGGLIYPFTTSSLKCKL